MANISFATISCTTSGKWQVRDKLNLERSLKFGEEVAGHLVTGHVDGIGKISNIEHVNHSLKILIDMPDSIKYYVAYKGSITVDGVALTVNAVNDCAMEINLIPHTITNSCFQYAKIGDHVNLEIDIMARYIARYMEKINV